MRYPHCVAALLLLIIISAGVDAADSPVSRGSIFFSGGFSIRDYSNDDQMTPSELTYDYNLDAGYVVLRGIAVGLHYNYLRSSWGSTRRYVYSLGPQIIVFPIDNKGFTPGENGRILPYLGAGLYRRQASIRNYYSVPIVRLSSPEYRLFTGMNVFLGKRAAIQFEYEIRFYKFNPYKSGGDTVVVNDDESDTEHSLHIGLALFIW